MLLQNLYATAEDAGGCRNCMLLQGLHASAETACRCRNCMRLQNNNPHSRAPSGMQKFQPSFHPANTIKILPCHLRIRYHPICSGRAPQQERTIPVYRRINAIYNGNFWPSPPDPVYFPPIPTMISQSPWGWGGKRALTRERNLFTTTLEKSELVLWGSKPV